MLGLRGNHYGFDADCAETLDGRVQSEAILALAYEQRTASLVAFYGIAIQLGAKDKATDDLQRQIVNRLGLKGEDAS